MAPHLRSRRGNLTNPKPRSANRDGASLRPLTTAVIVHWGGLSPTVELAERLCAISGINAVVVVANDLQSRPPDLVASASWLIPPRNLGFAGGFEHAYSSRPGADCYLLLNNDVELDDAAIAECQDVLVDPTIGIVAPVLVNSAGLQSGVGRLKRPLFKSDAHNYPSSNRVCDAQWVTGAIMFIRSTCYNETRFDVSYFLGWEDIDLCHRARNKGWRVVMASRAQAWHQGGTNFRKGIASYYYARNRVWFSRRWGTPAQACLVWLWIAAMITPRLFLADCLKRRTFDDTRSTLHALADGVMTLPASNIILSDEPRPAQWLRLL